jgi:hypothetical protein
LFRGLGLHATGLPLHFDNQSVFFERIHLDKAADRLSIGCK